MSEENNEINANDAVSDPETNQIFDPDNPGRSVYLLQFNKITKVLTGILSVVPIETLNRDLYYYQADTIDPINDVVVGKYPNYEIKPLVEMPTLMTEGTLNSLAEAKINKKYPIWRQANIMGSAIKQLLAALGETNDDLEEMLDYIEEVRHANAIRKESYQNNPDYRYLTDAEYEQVQLDRLEGGIHELSGPRTVQVNFDNIQ